MFACVLTNDSMKRNEKRNYCEHPRCKKTSRQIRKIRKSKLMIVTAANSLIESQNGDSDGAEKNISSESHHDARRARGSKPTRLNNQPRRDKRDVHGCVVLD